MEATAADGRSVLPLGRKTRALLAVLALAAPRPVSRTRLAELLWSRRHEDQARASLRQEIHRLLDALQPFGVDVLRVSRDHLALRPEAVWLDVTMVLAATPDNASGLALLDAALLSEFDGIDPALDQWLAVERGRLRDQARAVALTMLDEEAAPDAVLLSARNVIEIDPAHEGGWRALIRAHAALGERSMAIQAYERCRIALADLMGAQPAAETQQLLVDIRAGGPPPPPPAVPRHRSARVGVLPPQLIDAAREQVGFSIALAEAVTAALARFRWLALVSTSSLAQSGTRDETALRSEFGLDFLLDGSVHRVDRRLRVTLRLLDLRAGNLVVWARHFDCTIDDMLQIEDEIAAEAAAQIDPEMLLIESRRAAALSCDDSTAYDLVMRALPMIVRLRKAEFIEAGVLLARAVDLEPDNASAHFWRASWAGFSLAQGWADHPDEMLAIAGECADRAVALDPQDARGLTIAGHVRASLFSRPREGLELHRRALALNPNLSMAWGLSAMAYTYLGRYDDAAQSFARYKRLCPVDPQAFFFDAGMARLELSRRDYDLAIQHGRRSTELNPFYSASLKTYLSALGHAGHMSQVADIRQRLLAIEPDFTLNTALRRNPHEDSETVDHYVAGLMLAGVPSAHATASGELSHTAAGELSHASERRSA